MLGTKVSLHKILHVYTYMCKILEYSSIKYFFYSKTIALIWKSGYSLCSDWELYTLHITGKWLSYLWQVTRSYRCTHRKNKTPMEWRKIDFKMIYCLNVKCTIFRYCFSKYGHLYKIRKYIFFSKWKKIKEARINYLLIKVKR